MSAEFKSKESEIGQLLKTIFGLPLLAPQEVEDCFVNDLMAVKPIDDRLDQFFDYLLHTYITPTSEHPPPIWAEFTSSLERTTNCCESFHSKLNAHFCAPHPNIFALADALKEVQCDTYIKLRSKSKCRPKIMQQKETFVKDWMEKLSDGSVSRYAFLRHVCFKFLPVQK